MWRFALRVPGVVVREQGERGTGGQGGRGRRKRDDCVE